MGRSRSTRPSSRTRRTCAPRSQSPSFDPTRKYSAPWASGVTGIAYNIGITGKEIQTIDDFLAVEGTTTVLDEMRDTVGLFMRSLGIEHRRPDLRRRPSPRSTSSQTAFDDGKIDGTNGNEYVNDLGNGNLAAAFAWSGDVAQITLDNPDVRFAVPESGGMLWSDNFMIPYTTRQGRPRERVHQLLLRPGERGDAHGVHPVHLAGRRASPRSSPKMGGEAAELVDNPLVNPTDEFLADAQRSSARSSPDEEEKFDKRFAEITGSG